MFDAEMRAGAVFALIFLALPNCFAYVASSHDSQSASAKIRNEHYKDGEHDEHIDHQAILGSKKEAESFDKMSPDESKKRLGVLATKMDSNHDGFVDREELTKWIYESIQKLDREEMDERFEETDENSDHFVTWAEYKTDAFDSDDDEDDKESEYTLLLEEDFRLFQAADRNGDGKLTTEEFAAFQNPENHEHMHVSMIDNVLKDRDKNGDGYLNLEEYLGNYAIKKGQTNLMVEKSRFTDEYDKDGNGRLDRKEMQAWLVPDTMTTAKEEMEHLLNEADHNNDGKLSYEEIVSEYNLFVGSEATNYGEHLEEHDEF